MPIINVQMLTGRTATQKTAFIEQLAQAAIKTLDVPEQAITIVLTEVSPDDWAAGSRNMTELRRLGCAVPAAG